MGQCTAKANRTGERCRRDAIKGGRVCISHGGKAPQVKKAAARRFAEASDLTLEKFVGAVNDDEVKPEHLMAAARDFRKLVIDLDHAEVAAESGSAVDDYLASLRKDE